MGLLLWLFVGLGVYPVIHFWNVNRGLAITTIVVGVFIFWTGSMMWQDVYGGGFETPRILVSLNILACLYMIVVFVLSFIIN